MVARRVIETVSAQPTLEESKFTRALGSSDFHTREAGLAALRSWLTRKRDVDELDLLKLWKGIFYCFWHSDKADVQVRRHAWRTAWLQNS
jgi:ribosomal RNA-processing protein 1